MVGGTRDAPEEHGMTDVWIMMIMGRVIVNGPTVTASSPYIVTHLLVFIYCDRKHETSRSENRLITIAISLSFPSLPWGEVMRAKYSLYIQGFMPQERNPEVMTIRAYIGAEGTSGSLPL